MFDSTRYLLAYWAARNKTDKFSAYFAILQHVLAFFSYIYVHILRFSWHKNQGQSHYELFLILYYLVILEKILILNAKY